MLPVASALVIRINLCRVVGGILTIEYGCTCCLGKMTL